ncbi:hypothetical protein [uncultured Mediterranean phage uvMED]|nr:hypothetical protein [uncultured Mediterranean phage uvMED]
MQSKFISKDPNYQRNYQKANKEHLQAYQKAYRERRKLERQELRLMQIEESGEPTEKKPRKEHVFFVEQLQLNRPLGIEVLLTPFFKELKEYKLEMQKPYSTILQCTITELKEHIESQFVEGMNWKNIDIAKKNKTYHFKNLYPVWMQNK